MHCYVDRTFEHGSQLGQLNNAGGDELSRVELLGGHLELLWEWNIDHDQLHIGIGHAWSM